MRLMEEMSRLDCWLMSDDDDYVDEVLFAVTPLSHYVS